MGRTGPRVSLPGPPQDAGGKPEISGLLCGFTGGRFELSCGQHKTWAQGLFYRQVCATTVTICCSPNAEKCAAFTCRWVGMDSFFGKDTGFRDDIGERYDYFADICSDTMVWLERPEIGLPPYKGKGPHPQKEKPLTAPVEVRELAKTLSLETVNLGEGAKGPIFAEVACLRVIECRNGMPGIGKGFWRRCDLKYLNLPVNRLPFISHIFGLEIRKNCTSQAFLPRCLRFSSCLTGNRVKTAFGTYFPPCAYRQSWLYLASQSLVQSTELCWEY